MPYQIDIPSDDGYAFHKSGFNKPQLSLKKIIFFKAGKHRLLVNQIQLSKLKCQIND